MSHVALSVRDLPGMAAFYERIIGLQSMGGDAAVRRLGTGDRVLIELQGDPAARPHDPRQAGLFHTAFLLPDRAALGGWLRHAADAGQRLEGASDHGVSEALYLHDPEGNGIEIYRDRPATDWTRDGDRVHMITARLDLQALLDDGAEGWQGVPTDTIIGHVHLQVGQIDAADDFLTGDLGLTRTFDVPRAGWYGWDGYHHHLAVNVWNSEGAGPRPQGQTGLAEIALTSGTEKDPIEDPWGNRFRFV
ncbi:VOC family protein [Paracoccus nototheniae]|uniref:VOC family protein n=1 Tax=Paracoccus nototheniae TaxID=2489002 RepID=UPI0039ED0DA4